MTRGWSPTPAPRRKLRWWMFLPLVLLLFLPRPARVDTHAPPEAAPTPTEAPLPACVQPGLPQVETRQAAYTTQALLQGRLLLVDEAHPLPEGYTPPDTFGVLRHTQGRVECRDLSAVSGEDTLQALTDLFAAARQARYVQFAVFAGTRSAQQQRIWLTDTLAAFARDMPMAAALEAAVDAVGNVGCSEHQLPWAVDIRQCPIWNGAPLCQPFEATPAGRWLAEHCWEHGFIRRWPGALPADHCCRAYHLRYVGKAHAMLLHALDATLEEYLALLHRHGALTLYDESGAPLAAAVCLPAGERQTLFTLPSAQVEDASLDNTGYAVVACLFSTGSEASQATAPSLPGL